MLPAPAATATVPASVSNVIAQPAAAAGPTGGSRGGEENKESIISGTFGSQAADSNAAPGGSSLLYVDGKLLDYFDLDPRSDAWWDGVIGGKDER